MWKICYSENADVFPGLIARNNAVLEYEKFIHKTYYPYIIHPFSKFRITWEGIMLFLIPLRMIVSLFIWAVLDHKTFCFHALIIFFQLFNFIDVVLNFFTGFTDPVTEVAVLDPRKIAKRYISKYFIVDFIPCVPVQLFLMLLKVRHDVFEWGIFDFAVNITMFLDLLRLLTFWRYYLNLSRIKLWNPYFCDMMCLLFSVFVTLLFINDLYVTFFAMFLPEKVILKKSKPHISERLSVYFHTLFNMFLDCIYYDTDASSVYINLQAVILMCTFFFSIITSAYFIKFATVKMKPKEKFLDLESRVLSFVRKRHFPRALRNKTLLYFIILEANKYSRKDEIVNYIPDTFKADIFLHICLPLLKNFYAFEDLPTYVLRLLTECMKYQLYLPNELVVKKDNAKASMYFVHRGTVALYSSKHVELYHFEAGSSFNGRYMILGEIMMGGYAISIEVTEIYQLDREDFIDIMKTYPKLLLKIQEKCQIDKSESPRLFD